MTVSGFEIKRSIEFGQGEEYVGDERIVIRRIVPLTATARTGDAVFSVSDEELPENVSGASLAIVRRRTSRVPNYVLCENPRLVALGRIGWYIEPDAVVFVGENKHHRTNGASVAFERLPDGKIVHLAQLGGLTIGFGVRLGAYVNIDRGSLNTVNTEIGEDVVIGSHVHIAHNVKIGARAAIMDHACICGSAEIGEEAWIGPRVVVSDHVKIGARAHVGIGSVVLEDVPAGARVITEPRLVRL